MVYISCNVLKISLPIECIHFSGENCGYAELPIDEESLSQLLESDEARQYLSTEGLLDMLPSDAQQTGQLCAMVALAAIVVFRLVLTGSNIVVFCMLITILSTVELCRATALPFYLLSDNLVMDRTLFTL